MIAESDGLILRDYRSFWMGHKVDIEHTYTVNKSNQRRHRKNERGIRKIIREIPEHSEEKRASRRARSWLHSTNNSYNWQATTKKK
jgi:hypothetical protein